MRLEEYRQRVDKHFDVLDEFSDRVEGGRFLTKELESELSDYSREKVVTTVLDRPKKP